MDALQRIRERTSRLKELTTPLAAKQAVAEQDLAPVVAAVTDAVEAKAPEARTDAQIFDMEHNAIHAAMTDNAKSDASKLEWLETYLSPMDGDVETAINRYAAFEQYFAFRQSERKKIDRAGIVALIGQLKQTIQSQVHTIIEHVTSVQEGTEEIGKLLEVMRGARLEGKTIEQISAAIKLNDMLINTIHDANEAIGTLKGKQDYQQNYLRDQQQRKTESETGFMNKATRLLGPDKEIAIAIQFATSELAGVNLKLAEKERQLADSQAQRNTNLESGPLTILRTLDVTENGILQEIIGTAEAGLKLIDGIGTSTNILVADTAYHRRSAAEIQKMIVDTEAVDTILKTGLKRVLSATRVSGEAFKRNLDTLRTEIEAAEPDSTEAALKTIESKKVEGKYKSALGYQERLGKTVTTFELIASKTAESMAEAGNYEAMVNQLYEVISGLQNEALPATARGLRMNLEQNFALRTGELAASVVEVTNRAMKVSKNGMAGLTDAQKEMRAAELKHIDDTIKALEDARTVMGTSIDEIIDHGLIKQGKVGEMITAAQKLREVTQEFNEVGTIVTTQLGKSGVLTDEPAPLAPVAAPAAPAPNTPTVRG